jgi:hypothetical protein
MDDSAVYTLYLNTSDSFPNLYSNADKSNATWLVNWDNLFDGDQDKYNKCRVRVSLVSNQSASVTDSACKGVLVANFGTRYSASITRDTPIGIVNVFASTTAGQPYFAVDTLQTAGANINPQKGTSYLNLGLYKQSFGAGASANNVVTGVQVDYQAILTFELYDPR